MFLIFHDLQWMFLIFHDFQFSCNIPCATVDISKLSNFFSYPRLISCHKLCISHFLRISVFSPYSRSYSVHFSFFTFLSDFVIFQVVKWLFLIFHDFQFSCHIPYPTVDISKFSTFFSFPRHISRPKVYISHFHFPRHISRPKVYISRFLFLAIFHVLQWTFLNFPPFSVFLAIFHVLKCVFLIFRDFQFSRHITGPSVCISHFSRILVISSFFQSSSGCFSFSMIFSFLAIFHVLQWTFLNFPPFSDFLAIFHVLNFLAIFQVL
ncbi:hypothetical protein, partial [Plasmodium yoelii yoelii]